jgi:hypothetical protein
MILFKDHLEVLSHEEDIEAWLEGMDEYSQMEWAVKLQAGYPLGNPLKTNGLYEVIDVEQMSFGQFIMVEMLLNSDATFHSKMNSIAPLILRPNEGKFSNDDPEIEEALVESILNSDAAYIEDLFKRFLKHREGIVHKKYEGVVYKVGRKSLDDDEEQGTIADGEARFSKDWYFYSTAKSFVNDDLTRLQEAYELPMKTVFPEMVYRAQKNNIDEARARMEKAAASFRK